MRFNNLSKSYLTNNGVYRPMTKTDTLRIFMITVSFTGIHLEYNVYVFFGGVGGGRNRPQ